MTSGGNGERSSYASALRVIGRQLDAQSAHHVAIIETTAGFDVRYHPLAGREDVREMSIAWSRLEDLSIFHSAGRGVNRRPERRRGAWWETPGGRQELYRSLGAALDDLQARKVRIEERTDRLDVTYDVTPATDPGASDTRTWILDHDQMTALIEKERRRRATDQAATQS